MAAFSYNSIDVYGFAGLNKPLLTSYYYASTNNNSASSEILNRKYIANL